MNFKIASLVLAILFLGGCARAPLKTPDQAMRPTSDFPSLEDDLGWQNLKQALEANVRYLRDNSRDNRDFRFGPRFVSRQDYLRALEYLLNEAKRDDSGAAYKQAIRDRFEPFEVYGGESWGEVLITSYYEPFILAAKNRTSKFTQPLYGLPKSLVVIELDGFAQQKPGLSPLLDVVGEQRSTKTVWRGRLLNSNNVEEPSRVVAFPNRAGIYSGEIDKEAPILAWVDPIDAFFLEIQGSGVVRWPNGKELPVGYAAQNGHPYVPIGKHLLAAIPLEKMSQQRIEAHLRSIAADESRKIMEINPSFVFFKPLKSRGVTFLGAEVFDGRTIATDQRLFSKGTLAYLEFERPQFSSSQDVEPVAWQKTGRFVLDQDTGGAIRGPHRVDLFWGRGAEARQAAGVMKNKGRLVYFVPRMELIEQLRLQNSAIN